jgi:16S rRNA (uracil1498-N3)-methyltransferase
VIANDDPKKCLLEVTQRDTYHSSRNYYIHVIVAPTKNMDRMEWFLEKATEAGIDEVSFVESTNSERSKINMERLDKIMISAMKQSKQWFLPKLNAIEKLKEKQFEQSDVKLIAWCETEKTALLTHHFKTLTLQSPKITVMIGPEGDFTAEEINFVKQNGFIPCSLGTSILRTETAALYVCMAAKALLN